MGFECGLVERTTLVERRRIAFGRFANMFAQFERVGDQLEMRRAATAPRLVFDRCLLFRSGRLITSRLSDSGLDRNRFVRHRHHGIVSGGAGHRDHEWTFQGSKPRHTGRASSTRKAEEVGRGTGGIVKT